MKKFEVRIVTTSGNIETLTTPESDWTMSEVLNALTKEFARRQYLPNSVIGVHITLPLE